MDELVVIRQLIPGEEDLVPLLAADLIRAQVVAELEVPLEGVVVAVVERPVGLWAEVALVVVSLQVLHQLVLVVVVLPAEFAVRVVQRQPVVQELAAVQVLVQLDLLEKF